MTPCAPSFTHASNRSAASSNGAAVVTPIFVNSFFTYLYIAEKNNRAIRRKVFTTQIIAGVHPNGFMRSFGLTSSRHDGSRYVEGF